MASDRPKSFAYAVMRLVGLRQGTGDPSQMNCIKSKRRDSQRQHLLVSPTRALQRCALQAVLEPGTRTRAAETQGEDDHTRHVSTEQARALCDYRCSVNNKCATTREARQSISCCETTNSVVAALGAAFRAYASWCSFLVT